MMNDLTFDPVCTCFEMEDGTLDFDESCSIHGDKAIVNMYLAGTWKDG